MLTITHTHTYISTLTSFHHHSHFTLLYTHTQRTNALCHIISLSHVTLSLSHFTRVLSLHFTSLHFTSLHFTLHISQVSILSYLTNLSSRSNCSFTSKWVTPRYISRAGKRICIYVYEHVYDHITLIISC